MYNLPSSQGERVCVGAHMNDHRVREAECVELLMSNLPVGQENEVCGGSMNNLPSGQGTCMCEVSYEQSPNDSGNALWALITTLPLG